MIWVIDDSVDRRIVTGTVIIRPDSSRFLIKKRKNQIGDHQKTKTVTKLVKKGFGPKKIKKAAALSHKKNSPRVGFLF